MLSADMELPSTVTTFNLAPQFGQLTISTACPMAMEIAGPASVGGITTSPLSPTYTHISNIGTVAANSTVNNNTLSPNNPPSNSNNNSNLLMDSGLFPPGVASATTTLEYSTSLDLPDTKDNIEELCPVCGDKVSGYHYGLLTCESCKGFFKRTVQNKKVYTCVADRSCQIDKTQRKRCPFCRFQKCLEVGMKLEAVRADRMRGGRNKFGPMYKRDRARKLQMMRHRQMAQTGLITSRSNNAPVGITYSAPYTTSPPIKEEIQSPFLSSSTSSPDSSPAPMQGVSGALPPTPTSNVITVQGGHGGATATAIIGAPELSLFVGGIEATTGAPAQPTGNPSGAAANTGARVAAGGGAVATIAAPNNGGNGNVNNSLRIPTMVRQLLQTVDDNAWQTSLYSLLQTQTYNQCEVDLFELLCKVLDQNLFSQVDWARNSIFFKDLRVDDQMKLLQHSWSELLILDHLHQRIHNKLQDEMTLPNGQKFDLLSLALLGTTQFADRFQHVMNKLIELNFDVSDYICLKFVILLNPEIRALNDKRSVSTAREQIKQALIDYCHAMFPEEQERYQRLIDILGELHYIADNGERFLYFKHVHGAAPPQTLLMEMLHTKRR